MLGLSLENELIEQLGYLVQSCENAGQCVCCFFDIFKWTTISLLEPLMTADTLAGHAICS